MNIRTTIHADTVRAIQQRLSDAIGDEETPDAALALASMLAVCFMQMGDTKEDTLRLLANATAKMAGIIELDYERFRQFLKTGMN